MQVSQSIRNGTSEVPFIFNIQQHHCDSMIDEDNDESQSMDHDSVTSISVPFIVWSLAEEFLSLNRPEESIHLLTMLLERISLIKSPMIEVKTRLRLGDLLMRYASNYKKAEYCLMKAKLILDEMNFDEIQRYTDFHEIRLRLLQTLTNIYQYNGSLQEARKILKYSINYISTTLETMPDLQTPTAQLLYKYGDAFRFSLVKVYFQSKKLDEALAELEFFDQSNKSLWTISQITKLHIMMNKEPQKIEQILKFSEEIWDDIQNQLPESILSGKVLNGAESFWKKNYSLLQQICRYWAINALFLLGSTKWSFEQKVQFEENYSDNSSDDINITLADNAIAEFKKYFVALKLVKRCSSVQEIDEFMSIEELIIFELLLDQILMRSTKLKLQIDLKKSFKSSRFFIEKQESILLKNKVTHCKFDPVLEGQLYRLYALKILTQYNQCIYFLYEGHLSSCAENIISMMETLGKFPKLFADFHKQIHILIGLYFIQVRNIPSAIEHLELVEKSCAITDPHSSAWATVFHMIAQLNLHDLQNIPEKTRQQIFYKIDSTEKQEIFQSPGLRTSILFIKGCLYYSTGAIEDAIQHLREANTSVRITQNDEMRAQIDLQLSMAFSQSKNQNQSARFMMHALNLAVRGKAYYILSLAHRIQSYCSTNVALWKEEKFQEIDNYLKKEKENCKVHEEILKNWLPQKNDKYFYLREIADGGLTP